MNVPNEQTDRVVKVRAWVTDEHFGYDHWHARQFGAPSDARLAVLVVCRDEADRQRVLDALERGEP